MAAHNSRVAAKSALQLAHMPSCNLPAAPWLGPCQLARTGRPAVCCHESHLGPTPLWSSVPGLRMAPHGRLLSYWPYLGAVAALLGIVPLCHNHIFYTQSKCRRMAVWMRGKGAVASHSPGGAAAVAAVAPMLHVRAAAGCQPC